MDKSLKQQILTRSFNCGISSDEVSLAKSLVENKCKDKSIFVCEGLWAVEKLIEKNIKVTHFFYNIEKLVENKLDLDIYYKNLNKENIELLHSKGIKVNCWTCDDKEFAENLVSYGIDFITSNILE